MKKLNILFLCTGNSCRSQMAEGFAKYYKSDKYNVYSAGTESHGMNQRAIQVMKEAGVDISSHHSKTTDEFEKSLKFDFVFTVCDNAHENCPYFPGGKIIHVGFQDPPALTKNMTREEEILPIYRKVRDEIKSFVQEIEKYIEK